jgi:hypothetical protein
LERDLVKAVHWANGPYQAQSVAVWYAVRNCITSLSPLKRLSDFAFSPRSS